MVVPLLGPTVVDTEALRVLDAETHIQASLLRSASRVDTTVEQVEHIRAVYRTVVGQG